METTAVKSAFGWKAMNTFPIDCETRITITTMKRSSGLMTTTVVGSCKEGEMWYFTACKDYSGITTAKMGSVRTAAPSRDGLASKGKTKGTMVSMAGGKVLGTKVAAGNGMKSGGMTKKMNYGGKAC